MATTTQITPEAALAKFNAFVQSQQMQDYLSQRQQQYTSTPKGGTGWTGATVLDNPFAGLKQEQEYAVIGEGKRYTPRLQYDEYGGTKQGYIDSEGKFVEGALPEGLMKGMETPAGDYDASEYYYEPIRSDKLTDVGVDWKGTLGKIFSEQLGHKSTFTKAYSTTEKDAKGNPVEVTTPSLADIQSGKVAFLVGGKTGGESRERMAQMYLPMGDKLVPIGDPQYYKGEHPDARNVAMALQFAAIASLPFGGIGGLLGNVTGGIAGGIASLGIPQMVANIGANALVQGAFNAGIAKLVDMDAGKAFKSGAISGGIGAGVGELGAMSGLDKGLGSFYAPAKSLATSALTAKALGRPFDLGQAAKGAAVNYGLTQAIGAGGRALGMDAKQQNALFKFLNFAAPMIAARRKP